jgi:hypothetical protein
LPEFKYYLGVDVVSEIVAKNNKKYGSENVGFECDKFPYWLANLFGSKYQAVLFADMLVHLPNFMVELHLKAIKQTQVKYIFATTFPEIKENTDVELNEIAWRPINMAIAPYNMGEPIELIRYNEFYVGETGEKIREKYIGLWKIK